MGSSYSAPNYILYAIPIFFLLMGVELVVARRQGRRLYRFNDAISDLGCGISQQVGGAFLSVITIGSYIWIYENIRLFELPLDAWWTWLIGFVLYDLCYYWLHRKSHEVNILWAGHAPHHQSEEYNLAVALRQGLFQNPFTAPFYWPLAVLGFHPVLFLVVGQIITLYQFWIHTRTIKSMGPLEWLFNTPAHHRVHHGRNPRYLDKNHAGTFIIWDKLFGTFQQEDEEPVYGTIVPLRSWNPLWAQVQYLVHLWKEARRSANRRDLIRIWFMPTGWTPSKGKPLPYGGDPRPILSPPWDTPSHRALNGYVAVQFVVTLGLTVAFMIFHHALSPWENGVLAGLVFLTLLGMGGVLEAKRWALYAEPLRHGIIALAAGIYFGSIPVGFLSLLFGGIMSVWLLRSHSLFDTRHGGGRAMEPAQG